LFPQRILRIYSNYKRIECIEKEAVREIKIVLKNEKIFKHLFKRQKDKAEVITQKSGVKGGGAKH
jgi:hypothetical protein